jgi:SulP family sulfate permease
MTTASTFDSRAPVWRLVASESASVAVIGFALILANGVVAASPLGPTAVGTGLNAAFAAAVLGGAVAAWVARSPGEVSGPRVSVALLYAALAGTLSRAGHTQDLWAALALGVLLAGLTQALASVARLGTALRFTPYPVIAGFVTGTGLLVILGQVRSMFGADLGVLFADPAAWLQRLRPGSVAVGLAAIASVWIGARAAPRVPSALIGLAGGTIAHHVLSLWIPAGALGPTAGTTAMVLPNPSALIALWQPVTAGWLWETSQIAAPYSLLIALQGAVDSGLAARAVADRTGMPLSPNRALLAQGLGNMVSGVAGGLPIAVSPTQSMVAARAGRAAAWIPLTSTVVLLAAVVALAPVTPLVPLAALAGLLMTVGAALIDRWVRRLVALSWQHGPQRLQARVHLLVVSAVAATMVVAGVPAALLLGLMLAMLLLSTDVADASRFDVLSGETLASTRVWSALQAETLALARSAVAVVRPRGGLFFGNAERFAAVAESVRGVRYCVLDAGALVVMDATGSRALGLASSRLAARGIQTALAGIAYDSARGRSLRELGLDMPREQWWPTTDHALEWCETQLLVEAGLEPLPAITLVQCALFEGLTSDARTHVLAAFETRDVEPGERLTVQGTPGDTLFVVLSGRVEVQLPATAREPARRLAAFGPGGIVGEAALLTGQTRAADVVCVRPSHVAVLTRAALRELQRTGPEAHAAVIENLARHLARVLQASSRVVRL